MRERNQELEEEKDSMAGTLELLAEEISKLLVSVHVEEGVEVEKNIVSQFRSDCRTIVEMFNSMQSDVIELLKINDQIRAESSQSLLLER